MTVARCTLEQNQYTAVARGPAKAWHKALARAHDRAWHKALAKAKAPMPTVREEACAAPWDPTPRPSNAAHLFRKSADAFDARRLAKRCIAADGAELHGEQGLLAPVPVDAARREASHLHHAPLKRTIECERAWLAGSGTRDFAHNAQLQPWQRDVEHAFDLQRTKAFEAFRLEVSRNDPSATASAGGTELVDATGRPLWLGTFGEAYRAWGKERGDMEAEKEQMWRSWATADALYSPPHHLWFKVALADRLGEALTATIVALTAPDALPTCTRAFLPAPACDELAPGAKVLLLAPTAAALDGVLVAGLDPRYAPPHARLADGLCTRGPQWPACEAALHTQAGFRVPALEAVAAATLRCASLAAFDDAAYARCSFFACDVATMAQLCRQRRVHRDEFKLVVVAGLDLGLKGWQHGGGCYEEPELGAHHHVYSYLGSVPIVGFTGEEPSWTYHKAMSRCASPDICGDDSDEERDRNNDDEGCDWYRPRNAGAGADYGIGGIYDGRWRYDVDVDHPMYWLCDIPTIVRTTRGDVEAHDSA